MAGSWKEIYLAPKAFYRKIAAISVPLALQSVLNRGASFVDTIMVSRIGAVGAVAVAAQLENIMFSVSFGINVGIGIYASQFFGAGDRKSLKKCFGFQVLMNLLSFVLFFALAIFSGRSILRFYSSDAATVAKAWEYLRIACFGFFSTSIINAYSYMYRSVQRTKVPMYIGFGVNVINACLNFLLIFGKLGLPAMGIAGAAIATVIANSCGAVAHVVYAHYSKQAFLGSLKEMTDWDLTFLAPVIRRIVPLIANEALFGFGNTLYVKAYGIISATALDIYKIGSTVGDFFYVVVTGLNSAIGLIVGEQLGRKDLDGARLSVRRLFPVSAITAVAVIIAVSVVAPPIVSLFSTTEPAVTAAAVTMVRLVSVRIAFRLFNIIFMGTLRAGGDTLFLAFLDCGIVWLVGVPLAFAGVCLFGITSLPALYALIQTEQVVRLVIGFLRYRQGKWCRNLTDETMKEAQKH